MSFFQVTKNDLREHLVAMGTKFGEQVWPEIKIHLVENTLADENNEVDMGGDVIVTNDARVEALSDVIGNLFITTLAKVDGDSSMGAEAVYKEIWRIAGIIGAPFSLLRDNGVAYIKGTQADTSAKLTQFAKELDGMHPGPRWGRVGLVVLGGAGIGLAIRQGCRKWSR